jgi:hypothetical protein
VFVDADTVIERQYFIEKGRTAILHNKKGPAVISYDKRTFQPVENVYFRNGLLHSDCGLATDNEFYFHGVLHNWHGLAVLRCDGKGDLFYINGIRWDPTAKEYDDIEQDGYTGARVRMTRNADGEFHSFNDQPAIQVVDGVPIRLQEWRKNGRKHREDGPAILLTPYSEEGPVVIRGEWWQNGHKYRRGGAPAVLLYDVRGEVVQSEQFENGKRSVTRV